MLSGRGLCDKLITRPEESYRLWCVVVCDLETSRIGAPYIYIYIYMYIYDIRSLRVKTEIQLMWKVKSKSDAGNNRGKWNHFRITQTVPEQHTGKARYQVTTQNNHIGHCTHTAGSADVEVQNGYHWEWHYTCHKYLSISRQSSPLQAVTDQRPGECDILQQFG